MKHQAFLVIAIICIGFISCESSNSLQDLKAKMATSQEYHAYQLAHEQLAVIIGKRDIDLNAIFDYKHSLTKDENLCPFTAIESPKVMHWNAYAKAKCDLALKREVLEGKHPEFLEFSLEDKKAVYKIYRSQHELNIHQFINLDQ